MFDPIKCARCISECTNDIMGHDPRNWVKDIMWKMAKSGNISGEKFKKELEKKIKKEIKDIKNPEKYCKDIWHKIKSKCS